MKSKLTSLFIFVFTLSFSQEILTPEEAVKIAIENNYDIIISKNYLEIDQINVNRANAGMLPQVNGNFNLNNNITNSKQERTDGTVQELSNAKNNAINAGINLNWKIFDGFSMFARYDQLKEIQKQGETELQINILSLAGEVLATYFDLAQQMQIAEAYQQAIDLSQFRLEMAQNRFEIGKAAKLEVLNAQVDFNADQANLIRQKQSIENLKTYLNLLMSRDLQHEFEIVKDLEPNEALELANLIALAEVQNPQIQNTLINQTIAELELKRLKGEKLPQINLTSGYNFARNENSLGFSRLNTSYGFNYGLSVSINVFNGFLQKRRENIAQIQIENSQLQTEQLKKNIQSQLITYFNTYQTQLDLAKVEEKNEEIAKENLDITLEKLRIGSTTTLEVRTAQQNYIEAMTRTQNAKFQAKIAEIRLRELAGIILD